MDKIIDYKIRIPVEIEWLDAQTWNGTAEEFGEIIKWEPIISHTCGYLIHEDKDRIIVSFLNFGDESTKYFQMIPKGMVKKIIKLKGGIK
jgi:hypothetical protein